MHSSSDKVAVPIQDLNYRCSRESVNGSDSNGLFRREVALPEEPRDVLFTQLTVEIAVIVERSTTGYAGR
jgi:hypothetical protein